MLRRHLKRYKPLLSWYRKRVFGKPWEELNRRPSAWQKAVSTPASTYQNSIALNASVVILASQDASSLRMSTDSARAAGFNVYVVTDSMPPGDADAHYTTLSELASHPPAADWLCFINAGDQVLHNAAAVVHRAANTHVQARCLACDYFAGAEHQPVFLPPWLRYSCTPEAAFSRACWFDRELLTALCTTTPVNNAAAVPAMLLPALSAQQIVTTSELAFAFPEPATIEEPPIRFAGSDTTDAPTVTVIIPTRDNPELLSACIDSLRSQVDYTNYDIVIVDNQSQQPDTLQLLSRLGEHPKITVARYDAPFNYAAINNWAVAQTNSEFVVFLNDDVEIQSCHWLSTMLHYAKRDEVGAVGCKLLYGDRTVQHAGVAIGTLGGAAHKYKYLPETASGYFYELQTDHAVSAVTAACLLMRRDLFDTLGGFDETSLTVAFNDIDLCLKAAEAGKVNVVCNRVVHLHHESKSRGEDLSPEKAARFSSEKAYMEKRWQLSTTSDPFIHDGIQRRLNRRYER
ncbi:glycosyltransferase family 2 protein [Alteromonas halophila]|uniref:Glycosyltransferase 2-like domain-containing protein n=1 Tax=Alteromonas halophila TaxID=516698 RepID=A0A918JPK7_9ALTE|nr:glycosyltransferase family 2 protein [Alteromonas halophila]GGW92420.1 hypothetical protein GCM10007391_28490 [Alteromonas halophila]